VWEYEHVEHQRIRENQTDEMSLEQTEGGNHKKGHTEEERHTMTFGVCLGVSVDEEFGFSEEEAAEVSFEEEVERGEEDLEGDRVVCDVDLRKETIRSFTQYRNYNRMELTTKSGWDQYLPKDRTTSGPTHCGCTC
jgi:hypothetical protein